MFTSEEPGMSPPEIIVVGPERPGSGCIPEYHSEPAYTRSSGRYAEVGASEEQGLLLLIMGGCSRVSAFSFVQSQNERGWMDVGQNIRSEKVMRYY